MTEHRQPNHNQHRQKEKWPLDAHVQTLLDDESIHELSEAEQGKIIIDQFVGALMRKGQLEGSSDTYDPRSALRQVDDASNRASSDEAWMQSITRSNGLRRAAVMLAGDQRTGRFFGSLSGLVEKDTTGKDILGSMAQIEGYLFGQPDANVITPAMNNGSKLEGAQWIDVIKERMDIVLNQDGSWINDPHRGLIQSDNEYLRTQGNIWLKAVNSAKAAGVDIDLIGRSIEKLAQSKRTGKTIGSLAVSHAVEDSNHQRRIDSFFKN